MAHNFINLTPHEDRPNNVYRFIFDWINIPSSQDENSFYLIIHALVNWCDEPIFCILMQRSRNIGERIDVTEPVHIPERDIEKVTNAWINFIKERKGKGKT